jgi:hypothetical protein
MTPRFVPGDTVIVNRGTIATIITYSEEDNRFSFKVGDGGGSNTTYAHISNTQLEPLGGTAEAMPVTADLVEIVPGDPITAPEGDVYTTFDGMK